MLYCRSVQYSYSIFSCFGVHCLPARPVYRTANVQILWDNGTVIKVWSRTDLVYHTNHQWFSDILGIAVPPSQMGFYFFFFFSHMKPDSLSHDCTVAPASHQALFSLGNHLCPYLCTPRSCYDNSVRLISLLFKEWHSNDHFMYQWNTPNWMKRYHKMS